MLHTDWLLTPDWSDIQRNLIASDKPPPPRMLHTDWLLAPVTGSLTDLEESHLTSNNHQTSPPPVCPPDWLLSPDWSDIQSLWMHTLASDASPRLERPPPVCSTLTGYWPQTGATSRGISLHQTRFLPPPPCSLPITSPH